MLIISHRGNLRGPNSMKENHPNSIIECILLGYQTEIDLWMISSNLYLGHDSPEYMIDLDFIKKYSDKLWIHCKNIDAANFCCENNLYWFGHDNDDYVSVSSRNIIWRHPNSTISFTKRTIAVLPELSRLSLNDLNIIQGVCTDYPEIYMNDKITLIEKLYLPIYERMKYNQSIKLNMNGCKYDTLLSSSDNRRCLAIWGWLDNSIMSDKFYSLLENFNKIDECVSYDFNNQNGRLHFTLLQCFGFECMETENFNIERHRDDILNSIPMINIEWIEIICIETGIIMLGIPSIDVNQIRNLIINKYSFKEPYLNNIVHSTLLRFRTTLSKERLDDLKFKIRDIKNFGKTTIDRFYFDKASWLMNHFKTKPSPKK